MNPHSRDNGPHTKPLPMGKLIQLRGRPDLPMPDLFEEVEALAKAQSEVQSRLAFLAGVVEPESLASAVVGAMGNAAEEVREQLRPLRQALRDQGGDAA